MKKLTFVLVLSMAATTHSMVASGNERCRGADAHSKAACLRSSTPHTSQTAPFETPSGRSDAQVYQGQMPNMGR
jgi:hypothetical protein